MSADASCQSDSCKRRYRFVSAQTQWSQRPALSDWFCAEAERSRGVTPHSPLPTPHSHSRPADRHREMEPRALTDGAFHPDPPLVRLDNPLRDREPEADPAAVSGRTLPVAAEEMRQLLRRDAGTGVDDADAHLVGQRLGAER